MLPDAVVSAKMFDEPQVVLVPRETGVSKKKKLAIVVSVTLVLVVAMAVGGVLLAAHMTQKANDDMLKAYLVTFKEGKQSIQQEVEISTTEKLEAVHVAPSGGKKETFVLRDYKSGKTALRFTDDTSCYIRDMDENMLKTNVTGLDQAYREGQQKAGSITDTRQSYYQALDADVDHSTISSAILDFCDGLKLQLIKKTTKEEIEALTTAKSRKRRGLFDNFSAYANKRLNSIKSQLGGNGRSVGVASFGPKPPPPPPPRGFGGAIPIDNAYGPNDPYLGGGGVIGGHKDPYPVAPVGPKDPYQGGGHADPYDPHPVDYAPPAKSGGPCFQQSACKVNEGCTVRTERTCADYGWFFGNRGGVGRFRSLSDPKCLRWRYADVKDCVNVNKCEEICT